MSKIVANECEKENGEAPTLGVRVAQALRPQAAKVNWKVVARQQAQAHLAMGCGLGQQVRHVFRVQPGGERTLHTVVEHSVRQQAVGLIGCYRRPTLGDVVLGDFTL